MFNSDNLPGKIKQIENYIESHIEIIEKHPDSINISTSSYNENFETQLSKVNFHRFIQNADYHYFVSRILYLKHVYLYSFFSAQQCVECYLKAFLKYYKDPIPKTHDLKKILRKCRNFSIEQDIFINSKYIECIIEKFNPYNQFPRYPVSKFGPKNGQWITYHPIDVWFLDYFVYKMREILPMPSNTWDIFKNGHYDLCGTQRHEPDFYNLFIKDNINFMKK